MTSSPPASDRLCLQVAGPQDVDAILAIERACFASTWLPEQFLRDLSDNPAAHYVVARQGEEVVGHAGMYLVEDEAHVITVAVLPTARRRHIGTRLMLSLIDIARSKGAERMTLEVRVSNRGARALYEKLGFCSVAVRRGYYQDTGEDALLMWIPRLDAAWLRARWAREQQAIANR